MRILSGAFGPPFYCASLGGATNKVEARGTQGQQLLDLKEAYHKGVITEKEYNKTREEILDS